MEKTLLDTCNSVAEYLLEFMPDTGEADDNVLGWTRGNLEEHGGEIILWFLEDEGLLEEAGGLSHSGLLEMLRVV